MSDARGLLAISLATLQLAACSGTSLQISPEAASTGEPLAIPNWRVDETPLGESRYHLALRALSFRVGGDGEAYQIVKRRAQQLQRENGFVGYRIVGYSEGIESAIPLTYRVSEATIELVGAPPLR